MTRAEMEQRRLAAAGQLKAGNSQANITRAYAVSRTTASRWAAAIKRNADLCARKAPGRPPLVSKPRLEQLWDAMDPAEPITAKRFQIHIQTVTRVRYHIDHVRRIIEKLESGSW